jgi:serine/threonine protein kinase
MNLRHPCIAGPIGFVFGAESGCSHELKTVRLYLEGCSLAEVISVNPAWWTSTVKAKVIAGIVLGLRFAHSHGFVHGGLTTKNIVFDCDDCIEIVDFKGIEMKVGETEDEEETQLGGISSVGLAGKIDVHAFALILFEIVFGEPTNGETSVPTTVPRFVSKIIESGLRLESERETSFHKIFENLKENEFRIEDDVDSAEVSAFVNWVESTEHPEK